MFSIFAFLFLSCLFYHYYCKCLFVCKNIIYLLYFILWNSLGEALISFLTRECLLDVNAFVKNKMLFLHQILSLIASHYYL